MKRKKTKKDEEQIRRVKRKRTQSINIMREGEKQQNYKDHTKEKEDNQEEE